MSLRELFEQDAATANPVGCRVMQWIDRFDGDDADYLLELLGSTTPTDVIIRWVAKNNIDPIGKDRVNDHRRRRCTCAADVGGRVA